MVSRNETQIIRAIAAVLLSHILPQLDSYRETLYNIPAVLWA